MYLDFETYVTMGGTLEKTDFTRFNFQATSQINRASMSRITSEMKTTYAEILQYCAFDLIALFDQLYATNDAKVASEGNQGMSKSYAYATTDEVNQSILTVCQNYLSQVYDALGQPVTYLGVRHWS